MDHKNLFCTPATYRLLRAEYTAGLLTAAGLVIAHWSQVRWPVFAGLFAVIDLVGYLPGRIAWTRSRGGDGRIPRPYYVLYNTMHSLLTAGVIAAVWCVVVRPEWALLALAVHLFGDRALFGNFPKPFGFAFEPVTHPAYLELRSSYECHDDAAPVARIAA